MDARTAAAGLAAVSPSPELAGKHRLPAPQAAVAVLAVTIVFVWAYWSTLVELVATWDRIPDYSHGYLVAPFAALLLWLRRDRFPGTAGRIAWLGLGLVGASLLMRLAAAQYYLKALDGWTIPLWLAGVIWLVGGWRVCRWSLPCVAFLWFMVPLPFRAESWLSLPLQTSATKLSVWGLQCLGQPAIAEGHTILLGSNRLEVEQACSGLRVLVGIAALAFAYLLVARRPWWERLLVLLSVLPIALAANAIRIVATAFLYEYASSEAAKKFTHDFAGWATILVAAGLFAVALGYLRALFPEEEVLEVGDVLRVSRA